jgi:hypothetical protein
MYQLLERSTARDRAYRIMTRLKRDEARRLTAELEAAIEAQGRISVLFDLQDRPYGDIGALWEDLKFDVKHRRDIERVAVLGEGRLEHAAVAVFNALTPVECRFYARNEFEPAWAWLTAGHMAEA